ncbi:hypothetical protein GCM10011363_17700 [Marivita lacus]|uniref:Uncharacterized protein n=1 Tax=Marivita lacus TaxID=1323742 RepID=A0ABQ1KPW9_9RHOB|nr:hypothetical protein GCM10011363_17700 [Marivita lacus]
MAVSRQPGRMGARVVAPQQEGAGLVVQRIEHLGYQLLPAQPPMSARVAGRHREHIVQEQDALIGPEMQIAIGRCATDICLHLLEDIAQGPGQGSDAAIHRKRQTMRMSGRGIRVLPEDDHAHSIRVASLKGGKDLIVWRKNRSRLMRQ